MSEAAKLQYNADHQQAIAEKLASARILLPMVRELMPVDSVIDVGCGYGAFLAVWQELGVADWLGVEGPWITRENLLVEADRVVVRDLEAPLDLDSQADLAMCLEVGEHLTPARAPGLIADLVACAPTVLFSAAIPGQGGTGHINEQWPGYWVRLFRQQGYECVDAFRAGLWDNPRVCWWYAQNAFLFVRWNLLESQPALMTQWSPGLTMPLNVVHPRLYALTHRGAGG